MEFYTPKYKISVVYKPTSPASSCFFELICCTEALYEKIQIKSIESSSSPTRKHSIFYS